MAMSDDFAENVTVPQAIEQSRKESPSKEALLRAVEAYWRDSGIAPGDYSLCVLGEYPSAQEQDAAEGEDDLQWRRRVRHFLSQKARWPLGQAEEILKTLEIVIEPKEDGAPHGKVRFHDRHHTLSSKLLKDGQVYATYLYEWIRTLGQERLLADLLERNDPRLAPFMRKADGGRNKGTGNIGLPAPALRQLSALLQHKVQIAAQGRIARLQFHGPAAAGDGLVELALVPQGQAQVAVLPGIVRLQCH